MAIVQKVEEVKGNSPFKPFKFERVGDSVTMLFMGVADATSPTYGDFEVVQGLAFNPNASSVEEAVKSAELVSFPMQTVIANKVNNGLIRPREAYTFTMAWKKGDKYNGNKVAKANGYNIEHLILDEAARTALIKRYNELLGKTESSIVAAKEELTDDTVLTTPPTEPKL